MPSDPTRLRRILQFSIVLGLAAVLPDMGGARADCPYTNFFANAHDLPNGSTIVCPTDGIRSVPDGGELQGFFTLPNSLNWVYEQNGTVRGGSVCLNRSRAFSKWFSASVTLPPLLAPTS